MTPTIFKLVRTKPNDSPYIKRALYDLLRQEDFSIPKIEMYKRPVYPKKPQYTPYAIYMLWIKHEQDPANNPVPPYTLDEVNTQWAIYDAAWQEAFQEEEARKNQWIQSLNDLAEQMQQQGFAIMASYDKGATWTFDPILQFGKPYTWWDMVYYLTWTIKLWKYSKVNQAKWIALRNTGSGTAGLTTQPMSDLDVYGPGEIS